MDKEKIEGDELMKSIGSLDESSEALEEAAEDCEDREQVAVSFIIWISRLVERIWK